MSAPQFAPGEIVDGKYRIARQIGEGGMGAVFEAEAMRIHRRVAIKVLRADMAFDGEEAARFQLEAQAAGRIGSKHIVEVLDLGQLASGAPYMVMEFLDGESLRGRIKRQAPMPVDALATIADQLLTGVAAAHAAGIIHRDLKPDNVFLVRQNSGAEFVKLLDFGISKFDTGKDMRLTRTGALMGTPYYLAPEQANGSKVMDHRTDIYTVGVILYECLTGAVPFSGDTFNQLLFQIVLEPPAPLRDRAPNVDPAFALLVEKAMSKDPALRFQSADEMQLALAPWVSVSSGIPQRLTPPPPSGSRAFPATLPSSQARSETREPWAQTGTPRGVDLELELEKKPKRRSAVWLLVLSAVALAIAGAVALTFSGAEAPATSASVSASQDEPALAPPESPSPAVPALAAEPLPSSAPPTLPGTASETSVPVRRAGKAAPERASALVRGAAPRAEPPVPVAIPAPEPPPPPPPAAAPAAPSPAPAPNPEGPRMKGGRPIRGDL